MLMNMLEECRLFQPLPRRGEYLEEVKLLMMLDAETSDEGESD